MTISKEQFREFEAVRKAGEINMFDYKGIMARTSLSKDNIMEITQNYIDLSKRHNK